MKSNTLLKILVIVVYPSAIVPVAKHYNNAYIVVEVNDIGSQVADIIRYDYEYEYILSTTIRGRKGQVLGDGFGSGQVMGGIKTTDPIKRNGCSTLKSFIDEEKIIIEDFDIIKELTTFVKTRKSFEADKGHNDDLVMCLVMFCWMTTQEYFRELLDVDVRKAIYEDKIDEVEEEMTPFGFIDDGINEEETYTDSSGTEWSIDRSESDSLNGWYL